MVQYLDAVKGNVAGEARGKANRSPSQFTEEYESKSDAGSVWDSNDANQNHRHDDKKCKKKTTGPLHNSKYKAKLCKNWSKNGFCNYFEKCQFAHGQQELEKWAKHRAKLYAEAAEEQQGGSRSRRESKSPSLGSEMDSPKLTTTPATTTTTSSTASSSFKKPSTNSPVADQGNATPASVPGCLPQPQPATQAPEAQVKRDSRGSVTPVVSGGQRPFQPHHVFTPVEAQPASMDGYLSPTPPPNSVSPSVPAMVSQPPVVLQSQQVGATFENPFPHKAASFAKQPQYVHHQHQPQMPHPNPGYRQPPANPMHNPQQVPQMYHPQQQAPPQMFGGVQSNLHQDQWAAPMLDVNARGVFNNNNTSGNPSAATQEPQLMAATTPSDNPWASDPMRASPTVGFGIYMGENQELSGIHAAATSRLSEPNSEGDKWDSTAAAICPPRSTPSMLSDTESTPIDRELAEMNLSSSPSSQRTVYSPIDQLFNSPTLFAGPLSFSPVRDQAAI